MINTKQENTFQLVAYRYLAKCDFEDVVGIRHKIRDCHVEVLYFGKSCG